VAALAIIIAGSCGVWPVQAALVFRRLGQLEGYGRIQ